MEPDHDALEKNEESRFKSPKYGFSDNSDRKDYLPNQTQLLFEYGFLRDLIVHNESVALQILGGTAIAIIAITIIAFTTGISPVLTGLLLELGAFGAYAASFQALDRATSTYRTAAYIILYLESKLDDVKWESRLFHYRRYQQELENVNVFRRIPLVNFPVRNRQGPTENFVIFQVRLYSRLMLIWHMMAWCFIIYGLWPQPIALSPFGLNSIAGLFFATCFIALLALIFIILLVVIIYRILVMRETYQAEIRDYATTLTGLWINVENSAKASVPKSS